MNHVKCQGLTPTTSAPISLERTKKTTSDPRRNLLNYHPLKHPWYSTYAYQQELP